MEDQAARLRQLVGDKNEGSNAPVSPVVPPAVRKFAPTAPVTPAAAKTIAITSGKGGVGKTNLTVNLAIALGMAGKRVLVIDADLGMANVDVVLGTVSKYNLLHLQVINWKKWIQS